MNHPHPLISAAALAEMLGHVDVCVVDCRFDLFDVDAGRNAWLEAHIPGAVYADLDKDLAGPITATTGRHPLPNPERMSEILGRWGVDGECMVVVYDAGSGAIAARTWWMLHWLGHSRVALLDGGFSAWRDAGLAEESGPVTRSRREFRANPQHDMVITTEEVLRGLAARGGLRLVDARDSRRFRGEVEPIDRVAGHIPGTVNLPFAENLGENGRWKSAAQIAARFESVLGGCTDGRWSVMCGSGVTACHLALAATVAGLRMPSLYVGSWSEWVTDPARPVARAGGLPDQGPPVAERT